MTTVPEAAKFVCPDCSTENRADAIYCRQCGTRNDARVQAMTDSLRPQAASESLRPPVAAEPSRPSVAAEPSRPSLAADRPRPSVLHSQQPQRRRPRWFLGTFWAFWALVSLIAGFAGHPWFLLVAVGLGAYSVYLYRGGRYGWFFI